MRTREPWPLRAPFIARHSLVLMGPLAGFRRQIRSAAGWCSEDFSNTPPSCESLRKPEEIWVHLESFLFKLEGKSLFLTPGHSVSYWITVTTVLPQRCPTFQSVSPFYGFFAVSFCCPAKQKSFGKPIGNLRVRLNRKGNEGSALTYFQPRVVLQFSQ